MPGTKDVRTAFGLGFESDLALPEMDLRDVPADVRIVRGKVPEHLENASVATPWYESAGRDFLLHAAGIARYRVENGSLITFEPLGAASDEDARVLLLGSALPVLLLQRGLIALHGAAAVIGGQGVAILGSSQSGKTALALALRDRGCPLIADEICAVAVRDGKAVILPGIPQLNAWSDTLKRTGRDATNYPPIRGGLQKYAVREAGAFLGEPAPLSRVVLLINHNADDYQRDPVRAPPS